MTECNNTDIKHTMTVKVEYSMPDSTLSSTHALVRRAARNGLRQFYSTAHTNANTTAHFQRLYVSCVRSKTSSNATCSLLYNVQILT